MENIDTTGLSIEELGQMQQKLTSELSNIQTAYPVEGNTVSPESTLGLFWQYADKSGNHLGFRFSRNSYRHLEKHLNITRK